MKNNPHIDAFMANFPCEGLTFDDVSLVTRYADFLPDEADTHSRLTSRIQVSLPFASAAMDTVTEAAMAIAMARLGGIGVIHKNLSASRQVKQVHAVKHYLNGLILDPIVFRVADTLETVRQEKRRRDIEFNGYPVLDEHDKLAGILTSRDIKFTSTSQGGETIDKLMTRQVVTAPSGTTLKEAYDIMMNKRIGKLPLVDAQGALTGLYSLTDVKTLVENAHPFYNRDAQYRLRVAAAVSQNDHARVERLAQAEVDVIVVDSAHGHSQGILDMVQWIAKHYPDIDIVGGNIATGEGAIALRDAGAHAVKVGIGPGSICTTRVVCGVGVPQISAVYDCSKALQGTIPVIADGGIRHSGDVPKALAVGADTVMLGSILAGTEESPGEKILHEGRQYVVYRGMGSLAALQQAPGSRERYGQDKTRLNDLVPQGIEGIVPYAGTVEKVMNQYAGGLRATLGYCGCRTLPDLRQHARFVRVSPAGVSEAHPHDVKIIKEAPNYRT